MRGRSQVQQVASGLTKAEVHVWKLDLRWPAAGMERLKSYLSPDELERAEQLTHRFQRRRSMVARGGMRKLLAGYLGQVPSEIRFEYGPFGKPYLRGSRSSSEFSFNLSHSRDLALLAVTRNREVGIDVEYVKPNRDYLAVAQSCFSERERAQLAALPTSARREAFFHGWARKEAFIKALGLGLTFPLADFSVSLNPEAASLLEVCGEQQAAAKWQVIKLQVDGPFTAALAVEAGVTRVDFFAMTGVESDE